MVPGGGSRVSRTAWAILVAVVLCGAAVFVWWRGAGETTRSVDAELVRQVQEAENGETVVLVAEASQPPAKDGAPAERRPDYAAQLRSAPDLLEYVRSLLGMAHAGDHGAQFYIYRAFEYCADEYRLHFDRQGKRYSLDEAMRKGVAEGWSDPEVIRRAYDKCHALLEASVAEVGTREKWRRLAAEGGFPLAVVAMARELQRKSSRSPNPELSVQLRSLLAGPLKSRDPEVVWEIGDFEFAEYDEDGEFDRESMAWEIAACQRGFDCSPQSEAVRWLCMHDRACQPYESVSDILRRARGDQMDEIESRARWINEKIDAGDWAALGF